MKKQILRYLSGMIPVIVFLTQVRAQGENAGIEFYSRRLTFNEARASQALREEADTLNIHSRAARDLSERYEESYKAKWMESLQGYTAKFLNAGVDTRVSYDRKGHWLSTIRVYGEKGLPKEFRKLVRSEYYDYSIFMVVEVSVAGKIAYLVKIEDEKNVKTIRVMDGEMDVYEEFLKL